ncbi:MAG TPA: hypothetical protein PK605_00120 [Ignavibacteria bacterium]|nr:hypothetical protein [Ignavibacteria bacterium]HRF65941.1 hypothetical protein [Ignavibacteria bacterium]HRJ02783.1 hypothetical protein [Ignavibacteria bacterium]
MNQGRTGTPFVECFNCVDARIELQKQSGAISNPVVGFVTNNCII